MRGLLRFSRSPRGRLVVNLASALLAVGVGLLAARHFAESGWPLANADLGLVGAAGAFFLLSYAFKALGWQRLFAPAERPRRLTLAAASGAACVSGAALPGRVDDVVRVAVVRRYAGCPAGVATVCFSLFMLGLIDTVALVPLASAAAFTPEIAVPVRLAMGAVAGAGVGAALLLLVLPRLAASGRLLRFRITRWIGERVTTPREAWGAAALVLASWLARAIGLFLLLAALGVGISFALAIAFLCAAAASGALPVAPAGAITQAGAGAAILVAAGVGASQAVAFAVAAQALLILAGAGVIVFAAVLGGSSRLRLAFASLG